MYMRYREVNLQCPYQALHVCVPGNVVLVAQLVEVSPLEHVTNRMLTTSKGTPDKEGWPSSACSSNLAVSNLSRCRLCFNVSTRRQRVTGVDVRQSNLQ